MRSSDTKDAGEFLPELLASALSSEATGDTRRVSSLDFEDKLLLPGSTRSLNFTFSGISVLSPQLFRGFPDSKFRLVDVFLNAIPLGLLTGLKYDGRWYDVGTPERLNKLRQEFGNLPGKKN